MTDRAPLLSVNARRRGVLIIANAMYVFVPKYAMGPVLMVGV